MANTGSRHRDTAIFLILTIFADLNGKSCQRRELWKILPVHNKKSPEWIGGEIKIRNPLPCREANNENIFVLN
jgi:hypothetical protein